MAKIRKYTWNANSLGDGTCTAYSPYITGYIQSIEYVKTNYTDGVDFTITAEATGETIWTQSDVNAAVTVRPRGASHDVLGAVALYAAGGTGVQDRIALGRDRIKVVLAQVGATKTGAFIAIVADS